MEAARHAPFILAAYAAAFCILAGLIVRAVVDHRRARRALARIEAEEP